MNDKISTLICAHCPSDHHGDMLLRALESVDRQSRLPDEVVIVLDECIPNILPRVHAFAENSEMYFKILVKGEKEGLAYAKNYGLSYCDGQWITYLDADDQWMRCKLEVQERWINEINTPIDLCFTQAWDNFDGVWMPNCFATGQYESHEDIVAALKRENVLCHGSAMIRRDVFDKLVGYRNVTGAEDWDLWSRAVHEGFRFYNIPERLYVYSMGTSVER